MTACKRSCCSHFGSRNDSARILKDGAHGANVCCDAVVRGCAVCVLVGTAQWRPVAGVVEHFGCGS